jgi:DNA adenine methylase
LQQTSFAGKIKSPSFGYSSVKGPKLNLIRIEEYLSAAHLRLSRVYVECLPYAEVIRRYDGSDTFFYIDPPYWDFEDLYGRGIFEKEDFSALASQLEGIHGRFILSLNDTPGVRKIFSAFTVERIQVKYTCSKEKNLDAQEVLIRNF